jgi:hypothetical protein
MREYVEMIMKRKEGGLNHLLQHRACALCETNARAGSRFLALVFQPTPAWLVRLLWVVLARNLRTRVAALVCGS